MTKPENDLDRVNRKPGLNRTLLLALSLVILWTATTRPALADSFIDGLAAFDGGDLAETTRIWSMLADEGDANAQVGLAGLYLAGNGVARDPSEAARLYRLAAEQGDSNGQLNLGRLYLNGVGVERDMVAAYAWLSLAARQGRRWAEEQRLMIEASLSAEERSAANELINAFAP